MTALRPLFWRIFLPLAILNCIAINSQQSQKKLSKYRLSQLSFKELTKLANEVYDKEDYTYLNDILNVHYDKAKQEKDTLELANSLTYRIWYESSETGLNYLDSVLDITRNQKGSIFPARAYYLKGLILYEIDKPGMAMDNFIKGYYSSLLSKNHSQVVDCLNGIAVLKSEYGQEREGILLHREALDYLEKNSEGIDDYEWIKLLTVDNLTLGYLELRELDSARTYGKKGMQLSLLQNDTLVYRKMIIALAQANYYKGNYLKAKDTLLNYIDLYNGIKRADILYYLGEIENKLNNPQNRINYFEEIHQIVSKDSAIVDNSKDVYQTLLKDAMERGEKEKETEYLWWLVHNDSVLESMKRKVEEISLMKFDLPIQKLKTDFFESQISKKERYLNLFYCISFLLLLIGGILHYRYRTIQRRLKHLMHNKIEPFRADYKNIKKKINNIDKSVINILLNKINEWEHKEGYLNPDISMNSLAKEFGTNSAYLSKVINVYKEQSFSNYIKDLRISYSINFIKENPDFIKNKSIIQIAEHFGFKSLDVFARSLKDKTGVTPGVFLKWVSQRNL
ncbi:helix-turn-helix domain-containing protein [Ulvibacterium sp.]|uniref:helix-turn-helix domain-containing protein n=1 Tax=Ulvibacterium sp. TaxID=2665914 RepID=UPI003BAD893F